MDTAAGEQGPEAGEALWNTGDQLDQVEVALAPSQAGGDQDAVGRRLADQLVVQAILEQGLHGPRHQALEDMLIRYAVPVLRKLLADGQIISRASRLGRPPGSPGTLPELSEADREEFVRYMVADALPVFTRAVFEERRWTSVRQASLKTYFVNACILQFAQLHRQWLEQLREVLVLRGAGYTAEEAARQAGLTPKTAEGRLARLRQGLKRPRPGADPSERSRQGTGTGRRAQ